MTEVVKVEPAAAEAIIEAEGGGQSGRQHVGGQGEGRPAVFGRSILDRL